MDLLSVGQHEDHGGLGRHLLEVVVALGVRLLRRDLLALGERARRIAVRQLGEVRSDQLAVGGSLLRLGRLRR